MGPPQPKFVGRAKCAECHIEQVKRWMGSHHDLALQVADEQTVLGDFYDTTFTYFGVTSTFYRKDGDFMVRTDGPDGKLTDYRITYTFGVDPLQQYLIEFPGGRFQALGIAWDSRPKEAGGQRWFHLYPDEEVASGDELHWAGPNQNWNYMCAECHSTNLQKNYELEHDRYQTTWSEIDVSCEACHGPGSRHTEWAVSYKGKEDRASDPLKGLVLHMGDGAQWLMDTATGNARRSHSNISRTEIETCARCHSRRSVIHEPYQYGRPLMDTHRPALLEERLYYPDGQIKDEVYVYGSFLQSKMYAQGVTCSDCHDAHSLKLHAEGNALCARCHLPEKFDSVTHHHHPPASSGAQCVECHMPATTYMVVDPRRDHSFRVPRPDLSAKLETPNACQRCHADKSAQWNTAAFSEWYGDAGKRETHYGEAIHAGQTATGDAEGALLGIAGDPSQPPIVRATALSLLSRHATPVSMLTVKRSLGDADPLVRFAAVQFMETGEPSQRVRLVFPLLDDEVRMVRTEAARVLAAVPQRGLNPEQRARLDEAIEEYASTQRVNAERPESHLNLGLLRSTQGRFAEAEQAYNTALRLDTHFVPAYVNLADLYRMQDRDEEGERVFEQALAVAPENADVNHALGLLLVRQKRLPDALRALERAASLDPSNARYSYVLGVALNSTGEQARALTVLEEAHQRHPSDRQLLTALAMFSRQAGDNKAAVKYANRLVELYPRDNQARQLAAELQAAP